MLSDLWVPLIAGLVIPILVGLATKLEASSGLKRVLALFLSAAAGVLTGFVSAPDGDTFGWWAALIGAGVAFVTEVAAYYGLYDKVPPLKAQTAGFGLGSGKVPLHPAGVDEWPDPAPDAEPITDVEFRGGPVDPEVV